MIRSFAWIRHKSFFYSIGCILSGILGCSCDQKGRESCPLIYGFERIQTDPQNSPPARYDQSMATDWELKRIYLFGGRDGESFKNDLWVLDTRKAQWTEIHSSTKPEPRSGASLVYDPASKRLLLFGGFRANEIGESLFLQELWTYSDKLGWNREYFKEGPEGRAWHVAALQGNSMILFGGFSNPPLFHLNEIWSMDIKDFSFSRLATNGGPKMAGTPAMMPINSDRDILIFGREGIPKPTSTGFWELEIESDRWSATADKANSPETDFMLAVADPKTKTFLVIRENKEELNQKQLWLANANEKHFCMEQLDGGPSNIQGMKCVPDPSLELAWICFGGVWRNQLNANSWRIKPIAPR